MIKEQPSRTKSQKAKDLYASLEETANNKLTVKNTLLGIILPISLLIARTLAYLLLLPPDQLELDVFIILSIYLIFLVVLFIILYGFYEWKLRIDLKRQDLVEQNALTKLINKEFKLLNTKIEDKAKETIMSTGIMVNGMNSDPEETQEILTELENIDYSPNGVDKVDIDITRNALKVIEEQLAKQEQLELDNLTKDLPQDPAVEELSHTNNDNVTDILDADPIKFAKIDSVKITPLPEPEEDPEPEQEEEPEVFEDEKGNKYTFNADGSLNYI